MESRETRQVDGSLGVAGAAQDTFVLGVEGIDVARAAEVGGLAGGVGQSADGGGAVVGGDAGGAALEQIHRHREGRAQHGGVLLYLMVQLQFAGP